MIDTGWVYKDFRELNTVIVIVCPCSLGDIVIQQSKEVESAENIHFCPKCGRKVEFSPY